jgi:acyl carrier protein
MDQKEIKERLGPIVRRYIPAENREKEISERDDLLSDLGINSAHLVDIIIDLEDEFDIEISDEEAEEMLTVGKSIEVIRQKLTHDRP